MLVLLGLMLPFQRSANAANPQPVSGWSIGVRGVDTGIANPPLYSVSCPALSECLALGYTANEQNSLFLSSDGGATWFNTLGPGTPIGTTGVALNSITCAGIISCFIVANTATLNPGAESAFVYFGHPGHWTQAALPTDIANSTLERINCVDSLHCWVPSNSAAGPAVGVTTDGGATWTSHRLSSSVSTLSAVSFTDLNHGVAVGPSGTLLRTDNGGSTWAAATSPVATDFIDVSCPSASRCWAVGTTTASASAAIVTTLDGGATWTTQQAPPQVGLIALSCVKTRRASETACWAVGYSNTGNGAVVANTTDAGAHWLSQPMPNAIGGAGAALTSVSCTDISHCAAVGWDSTHTGAFLWTTNGGASGVDADGDGIPDALEQQLAEQYAPTLLFAANEPNMPVNVNWMLTHTGSMNFYEKCFPVDTFLVAVSPLSSQDQLLHTVTQHSTCRNNLPPIGSATPNPDSQQFGGSNSDAREAFYLPNVSTADQVGETDPSKWVTYVHSYPTIDGGIMLQYWHLFAYNDYQHRFCPKFCTDQHGGDWDAQVQVQLNAQLQPEGVWFSRHTHDNPGDFVRAAQVHWLNQTHPIVSIDSGGHAAYASPQDFCAYHQADFGPFHVNPSDAPWSNDASASNIRQIECNGNSPRPQASWPLTGGTVWNTASGGQVAQVTPRGSTPTVRISGNAGGLLTLLGQYNPGSETCGANCAGTPAGTARPLNGQIFIEYSGFWGNPIINGFGFPPRGPVFQGYQSGSGYTSWYNQASSSAWQRTP